MDRSWFDTDDLGLGLGLNRRWASLTSHDASTVSHQMSLLEDSMELTATSTRLRKTARMVVGGHTSGLLGPGFASRRIDLAHRINTLMRSSGDGVKCSQEDYDELTKNFRAIKEENLKLKAVINDVTEVNKRWQKYNNDRQIYVQRLLTTIQDQQEQINKMVTNRAFLTLAPPPVEDVESSSLLQEEVSRLKRHLERTDLEHGETVQVLKFQVKAHHDDWEAERREKQQALQDKLTAEAKIRVLQKELRAHKLKLREDRLENENRCGCCCPHASEEHEASADLPVSRHEYCRNEHTKTYRTSVHVPCNAGHLLSRGTTLSFDDDLATDSDKNKTEQHNGLTSYDTTTSRSSFDKCLENNHTASMDEAEEPKENVGFESAGNLLRNGMNCGKLQANKNVSALKNYGQDIVRTDSDLSGLVQSDSQSTVGSTSLLSCSVLHIPSTQNSSTTSLLSKCDLPQTSSTTSLPSESEASKGGVTIGFNNNGLASVLSFQQTPIVKSFSLPNQTEVKSVEPQPPALVRPPPETFALSAESLWQDKKPTKLSLLGAFAKSVKQTRPAEEYRRKSEDAASQELSWTPKYFENGVDTQTREDIICPVCDLLFPPTSHVKFLDHFGRCQNNAVEQKLKRI